MTLVRDIMTAPVVAVRPETTLAEAVRILTKHHIGGAPVVSPDGALVGIISELALIDVAFEPDVKDACVAQYMAQDIQFVLPDEPLMRAAQLFALYSFRRLPVVENGKLVGILSRRDLMNHALRSNERLREPLVELVPTLEIMS